MGVDRTDYLMLAARFTWDEFYAGCSHYNNEDGMERAEEFQAPFEDNGHTAEITAPGGFAVLSGEADDDVGGDYFMIGRIIEKALYSDGFPLTDCDRTWTEEEARTMEVLIQKSFPFLADLKREVGLWLFSHYH